MRIVYLLVRAPKAVGPHLVVSPVAAEEADHRKAARRRFEDRGGASSSTICFLEFFPTGAVRRRGEGKIGDVR